MDHLQAQAEYASSDSEANQSMAALLNLWAQGRHKCVQAQEPPLLAHSRLSRRLFLFQGKAQATRAIPLSFTGLKIILYGGSGKHTAGIHFHS